MALNQQFHLPFLIFSYLNFITLQFIAVYCTQCIVNDAIDNR